MRYPEIARQSGMEGRVVAKVLVGTNGSVIKVGGISGPEVFRDEVSDKVMGLEIYSCFTKWTTCKMLGKRSI